MAHWVLRTELKPTLIDSQRTKPWFWLIFATALWASSGDSREHANVDD